MISIPSIGNRNVFPNHRRLALWLGLALLTPMGLLAGAWRINPGSGTAIANFSYLTADSYSDENGDLHDLHLQEVAATLYGTYGVYTDLSLGAAISPHKIFLTPNRNAYGISDLNVWLDHHLSSIGAWQFAFRYQMVFPIGLENPAWTPDDLYAIHSQGALGLGAMPLVGVSKNRFWLQGGAGFKLRGRDHAAQTNFQVDAGCGLGVPWLSLRAALAGLMPLDSKSNGMPSDQEQFLGDQIALEIRLPRLWRLGMQFDSMIPPGQAMPQGLRSNFYLGWSWI